MQTLLFHIQQHTNDNQVIYLLIQKLYSSSHRRDETTKRPSMLFRRCHTRHSGFFNFERKLIMKSTTAATLVLALSALVAGQAMAANIDASNPSELDFATVSATQDVASTKTRADVRAEVLQAKRVNVDASNPSELDFAAIAAQQGASTVTRAEVRAELAQAQRAAKPDYSQFW
jgi:hypothetical protein